MTIQKNDRDNVIIEATVIDDNGEQKTTQKVCVKYGGT